MLLLAKSNGEAACPNDVQSGGGRENFCLDGAEIIYDRCSLIVS